MSSDQIRVVMRCKPSAEEKTWVVDGNILEEKGANSPALEFDNVFGDATSHSDLYNEAITPLVATALQGNNVSMITYGLPCTGKSYTVFGTSGQTRIKQEARGLITRCGQQIFDLLQREEHTGSVSRISATFCHVFEDGRVADLFDTKKRNLEILEDTTMVYSVLHPTEQVVTSAQEILRLVEKGYLMRNATGCVRESTGRKLTATMQPLQQYRQHCSHAIFTLSIEHTPSISDSNEVTVSRIMVVDLSGKSIEEFHTNGMTSDSGVEMLHKVMMSLPSDGITAASALFPKSSLTKLLKPCLGGNSQSMLIANVCLSQSSTAINRKCLEFLHKARLIKNYSKPTTISLSQSTLGRFLDESSNLKAAVAQKLQISSPVITWEAVRDTAVQINGTLYEQLSLSCQDLVKKLAVVEAQLLHSGKPSLKGDGRPTAPSGPLSMLRPAVRPPPQLLITTDKPPIKPLKPLLPDPLKTQQTSTTQGSSESSSSLEESESDSDAEPPDTPVVHGPPPPPLRGIPHINPDATPTVPVTVLPAPATKQASSPVNTATVSSSVSHAPKQQPEISTHLVQQQIPKPLPPVTASPQSSVPSQSPTRLTPLVTVVLPKAHTSTPKARRSLLPELASQSHQEAKRVQPLKSIMGDQPSPPPAVDATQLRQNAVPTPLPTGPITSPTAFPRVTLSPIRPMGMAPSLLSRPMLLPVRGTQHALSTSTMASSTGDSLSDSSSSDEDLSDEARDNFDPNIQQRRLAMQSTRPYGALHNPLIAVTRHAVLPPIARGTSVTPHNTQGNPPSYEQVSLSRPPDYYQETGQTRSEGAGGEGARGEGDMSQYISSEEIHVAAMEGVKASTMKKLVVRFGVDYRDHGGRTPLMYAILGNQPKICEVLLSLGAVVNVRDSSGLTPLLWATYQAKPLVMKTLLRHGADSLVCDLEGRNVYHWAVKTPNIQCLKVLCKQANTGIVNKPDNEGLTPLHWAVMGDQASHIRILLTSTNADASLQDKEGRTPLNYAVLSFSPSAIKAILDCCESVVNVTDPKGRTALHYACAEGSADCIRTLLSYQSCDLHCTDARGTTPLHWAAAANQPGLVQLLLRRGADRAQKDNDNMTALGHAQQRGHTECIRILQTYGLRRPMSAISIASQFSLVPTPSPAIDEFGHVPLRRPNRRFSLSGTSVSSIDRMPADGQAHSEAGSPEEQPPIQEGTGEQVSESPEHTPQTRWAESRSSQQPREGEVRRRRRWLSLLCCSGQTNTVVPVESTHSDTT